MALAGREPEDVLYYTEQIMTWEEFMGPLMVQFVAPLAITLAGGAITYIVAQVGPVIKKTINVDIDAKLNALLHAALERAVAAALAKYPGGNLSATIVGEVAKSLRATNPDTLARFDLTTDQSKLDKLINNEILKQQGFTR